MAPEHSTQIAKLLEPTSESAASGATEWPLTEEQICSSVNSENRNLGSNSYLAVYGSLRRRVLARRGLAVARNLSFFGHGILRGQLFAQNGYPGAVEGPGVIRVEIFRVRDKTVFQVLDFYEGFSPDSKGYCLFDRKLIRLLRPGILASAYFLARQTPRGQPKFRISAEAKMASRNRRLGRRRFRIRP
jgi:gamma-glutamylcyclotransferase (GGCT)/AIG2-like uncharacterized protein YtfP